jgi:predicted MPP superfamily phosphohydrolase
MGAISMILLYALAAYAAVGIAVAFAFVTVGVARVQAMPVTIGARIMLLPGAFVLWPLVAARWHRSCGTR